MNFLPAVDKKRRLCRSCACLVRTFLRHFNLILCHCVNTTDCRCGCREIERAQVLFGCLHHLFRLWLLRFRVSYTCSGTFTLFSTSACLSPGEFGRWHRSAMRCTRDNTSALSLCLCVFHQPNMSSRDSRVSLQLSSLNCSVWLTALTAADYWNWLFVSMHAECVIIRPTMFPQRTLGASYL